MRGKENDLAFGKKNKTQPQAECENVVQTSRNEHPYSCLSGVFPSQKSEMRLYQTVADAVPKILSSADSVLVTELDAENAIVGFIL